MVKKNREIAMTSPLTEPVDCACVIHGDVYNWDYVERLYNMLNRHVSTGIRLHVYTEPHRDVPAPYIKHSLIDLGVSGPRRSWWYKMQLFNSELFMGPLLYFDLDVVITKNIDWICQLPTSYFWSVRDFKYLWRPHHTGVNSSIMRWDTARYDWIWRDFKLHKLEELIRRHHGDQDYITEKIPDIERRFLDIERIKSWRWQALDGGYDFVKRRYLTPGQGTKLTDKTSVLIFHGKPKPEDSQDPVILNHWQ